MASTTPPDEYRYQRFLAKSINAERAALGWTIAELAERSGIEYQTLLRKLNLKRHLTWAEVGQLADALGTRSSALAADAEARMDREPEPDIHPEDAAIIASAPELTERQRREARRALTGEDDGSRPSDVRGTSTGPLDSPGRRRSAR